MQTIGVVSQLGDTLHTNSMGALAFLDTASDVSVSQWQVDHFTEDTAIDLLKKHNRFNVVRLDQASTGTKKYGNDRLDELFRQAKRQHIDTLVVVNPALNEVNRREFRAGYGLNTVNNVFHGQQQCVYSSFIVKVYRVDSGQSVGWEWNTDKWPCEKMRSITAEQRLYESYSDADKEDIHQRLQVRIASGVAYALNKMHLVHDGDAAK